MSLHQPSRAEFRVVIKVNLVTIHPKYVSFRQMRPGNILGSLKTAPLALLLLSKRWDPIFHTWWLLSYLQIVFFFATLERRRFKESSSLKSVRKNRQTLNASKVLCHIFSEFLSTRAASLLVLGATHLLMPFVEQGKRQELSICWLVGGKRRRILESISKDRPTLQDDVASFG